jgi:hypothetical protein
MRNPGVVIRSLALYAGGLLLVLIGATIAHHSEDRAPAVIKFEPRMQDAPRLPVRQAPRADRRRIYWI